MACDGTHIFLQCINHGLIKLNCAGQEAGLLSANNSKFNIGVNGRLVVLNEIHIGFLRRSTYVGSIGDKDPSLLLDVVDKTSLALHSTLCVDVKHRGDNEGKKGAESEMEDHEEQTTFDRNVEYISLRC